MAEGMLGGMLGGDEEKPEVEAPEPLAGAEAFAAAVAAKLAGGDPGVARKTEEFLSEQTELLKVQKEHLKDEHAARLHFLRGQAREVDIRRFGLRLRVGFQLFLVLVATVIGIGAAIMIHDAVTSRRVVMEPFHAPPGLAARGIDGVVVAGGLLDELSHLQDATRSTFAARVLSGAWTGNIKLDVPETGVSVGEISRLLRERFGHDIHIDGDLVETAKGDLALTVRGNGVPAKTFGGSATDLETLTIQAAEYIYARSQPARWASYLTNAGRDQEALEFCPSAIPGADPQERPGLLNTWGLAIQNTGGSMRESLELFRTAVKLNRDTWAAIGDEEGAWKRSGARKAYAEALALAPDLPAAYYSWGVALAKHGDLEGAIAKFKDSNLRGPHWADPLKAWGDVLVNQGHAREALAKYEEALKYPPNWKQLKEAREVLAHPKT